MSLERQLLLKAETTVMLMDAGIAMMRQNLRRQHPTAGSSRIEALMAAWLHRDNDPLPGDVAGAVRVRRLDS